MSTWSPRGEPTWPSWRYATPGTRVRSVRTGATGTFVLAKHSKRGTSSGCSYAVVDWDDVGFGIVRGRVVAPAYELEPENGEER